MPVVIAPRFNGPPTSGHGGYSCGCAAAQVDATVVEVTLRRPPPLGVELTVAHDDGGASLLHDDAVVASGRFAWAHDHPFPTCFGCGPQRDPADALCLFTGPVGDGRFAVRWTPPAWTGDGVVEPVFAWAALDCPSSSPVHGTIDAPVVLGRFTVALEGPIE